MLHLHRTQMIVIMIVCLTDIDSCSMFISKTYKYLIHYSQLV